MEVIAGAGPAEFGNHDALAGVQAAKLVVNCNGFIDRLGRVSAGPVGQDVRGDEVDRRGKLRVIDPRRPDFASRDRDRARSLHTLDDLDKVVQAGFRPQHGLVADHDGVDVAVMPGEIERGADFALVTLLVLVDPGADGDLEAEFGGDGRDQFGAAGRGIGADGARIGRDGLEVGADLLGGRALPPVGMLEVDEWRVGNTGKLAGKIRSRFFSS